MLPAFRILIGRNETGEVYRATVDYPRESLAPGSESNLFGRMAEKGANGCR